MSTKSTGTTSSSHENARVAITIELSIVHSLLRLLDPSSPFQPILVGSIDLVAWQAFYGKAIETIKGLLPRGLASLPPHAQKKILASARPLFLMTRSVCDSPQIHASEHAADLHNQGLLPDLTDLAPDSCIAPEQEELMNDAIEKSRDFIRQTAVQLALLRKDLATSAKRLTGSLTRKNGLVWLLKRRLKKSKRSTERFQGLLDELDSVLMSPPPSSETPWDEARRWFARLAVVVEVHLLPELDAILRDTIPRAPASPRTPGTAPPPKRQSVKDNFSRSWDAFLQTYMAACNVAAAQDSYPFWCLFYSLTQAFTSSLVAEGVLDVRAAQRTDDTRVIAGVSLLDHRVIARSLLERWNQILFAEDDYALQILLAGLHHLETTDQPDADPANSRCRTTYAFSEHTMARWLSLGGYAGENPDREASKRFLTETRRTRRALEHLRRNGAAFHGRRQWTPLQNKVTDAASNRLWTVNPMLAAHPQIKTRVAAVPGIFVEHIAPRDARRRPSRRNRGTRRKS
jgi:hypothetical protein